MFSVEEFSLSRPFVLLRLYLVHLNINQPARLMTDTLQEEKLSRNLGGGSKRGTKYKGMQSYSVKHDKEGNGRRGYHQSHGAELLSTTIYSYTHPPISGAGTSSRIYNY
ncbi:hypothetical protein GDO81_014524 [Engystomops pustulosus]|uniref:Uncharacterized protein n=1 Tax=Engystomops pustulosus TaxID=76066 RepID=A0AAV7BB19_ENGPU|nr:hypothetical protein GDO81_014524 [Engystomops pustulosus]